MGLVGNILASEPVVIVVLEDEILVHNVPLIEAIAQDEMQELIAGMSHPHNPKLGEKALT